VHVARLHGVWGLGQVLRQFRGQVTAFETRMETVRTLVDLLSDENPHVRAQSAKVLGEGRAEEALEELIRLAADPEPSVRFQAVMSLGRLNQLSALPAVLAMLRENNDADPLADPLQKLRTLGTLESMFGGNVADFMSKNRSKLSLIVQCRQECLTDKDHPPRRCEGILDRAVQDREMVRDGRTQTTLRHDRTDEIDVLLQAFIVDRPTEALHTLQSQGFADRSLCRVVDLLTAAEHLRGAGKDFAFLGLRIGQLLQLIHPGGVGGHGNHETTE
jgi:hypothetical protein